MRRDANETTTRRRHRRDDATDAPFTQVMDDLHKQDASKAGFLDQATAMRSLKLIAVGGAVDQDPGQPQLPPLVLETKCSSRDLSWSRHLKSAESLTAVLMGPVAALVCAMLADNEGDVETFPSNETLATLTSMTYTALDRNQSIFAGRVVTLVAIPLGPNGELLLGDAVRWEREGEHSIENVASNEILSRTARSVSGIGSVVALRARVNEQSQAALDELAAAQKLMLDRENRIAEALEKARANGNEPLVAFVLWQQTKGLGALSDSEVALRTFSDEQAYEIRLSLAKAGAVSLEARSKGMQGTIPDRLEDAFSLVERTMACHVVILVANGHVFEPTPDRIRQRFLKEAVYQARWLTAGAVPTLLASPDLFDNIDDPSLDPFRPYKKTTTETERAWRVPGLVPVRDVR